MVNSAVVVAFSAGRVADGDALALGVLEVDVVVAGGGDVDELEALGAVYLNLAYLADGGEYVVGVLKVALLAVLDGIQETQVELGWAELHNEGLHALGGQLFAVKNNVFAHIDLLIHVYYFMEPVSRKRMCQESASSSTWGVCFPAETFSAVL